MWIFLKFECRLGWNLIICIFVTLFRFKFYVFSLSVQYLCYCFAWFCWVQWQVGWKERLQYFVSSGILNLNSVNVYHSVLHCVLCDATVTRNCLDAWNKSIDWLIDWLIEYILSTNCVTAKLFSGVLLHDATEPSYVSRSLMSLFFYVVSEMNWNGSWWTTD